MSNARDKANIPALNFSSTGIDDNATSTAITIDSSQNVDVAGTITADGLTVQNNGVLAGISISGNNAPALKIQDATSSAYGVLFGQNNGVLILDADNTNIDASSSLSLRHDGKQAIVIGSGGNISFYEDTGTTPKMIWNASTESLSIGSSNNPDENLHIQTSDSTAGTIKLQRGTSGVVLGEAVGELKFATNDTSYTATSGTDEVAKISAISEHGSGDRYGLAFYTGIFSESTPGERLRITNTGSVGINTTSISPAKIKVVADIGPDGAFVFQQNRTSSASYDMSLYKNNTTQDDNISRYLTCQDNTAGRLIIYGDGDVKNHDNSYGSLSDERIKQDIRDSNSQWNDIKNIRVRNFKKKDDVRQYGENAWEQIGVIAQELETVSPKLIKHSDPTSSDILSDSSFGTLYQEGDEIPEGKNVGDVKEIHQQVKGVSYSVLYMKSIKALQEAMERIETLEAKVQTLENNQP